MQGHYHAVVWIDGHEAKVFHFNADDVEKNVIHPHNSDKDRRREKHSGHASADNAHFLEAGDTGDCRRRRHPRSPGQAWKRPSC